MKDDYSDVVFSQGLVCLNTNNNAICVVIDGNRGTPTDRASLVMEYNAERVFMFHTPPNRTLKPTGKIKDLSSLAKTIRKYVATEDGEQE